ncbi:hypothetical protein MQE36_07945 [Zhouia spongiae]|uniref:LamG-like jellyroll fold domain-containing protein n=1 Tax=Zhouia spongiae TaxID=2202721 RepID=A0ABY3YRF0_9FLAO|nr:LamG-like jellyroll fold domain-containing protein [Zhouia spongiae]UNZ00259.1 hypothetical protein MQE36_07945 [Zhouia spongiae]
MNILNVNPFYCLFVILYCQLCFPQHDKAAITLLSDKEKVPEGMYILDFSRGSITFKEEVIDYAIDLVNVDTVYWNRSKIDSVVQDKGILPEYAIRDAAGYYDDYIDQLNNFKRSGVNVVINGEPLVDVGWKEHNLKTTGVFTAIAAKLSPQKRGFWFSPDIFNFDDYHIDEPKVFTAYKYNLTEKLTFFLPFKKTVDNEIATGQVAAGKDVEFVKDHQRGNVAYFNGNTSYIDFRADNDENFKEITIAAWVKPEDVSDSHSIIGKGEVFSAKIYQGRMMFTTPGIKDHQTSEKIVKPNEWNHLAFVYLPNSKMYFYLNGEQVYETKASIIEQSDHSILIGSNLWGQNYKGAMSEFALWTRALSNEEIMQVYTDGITWENKGSGTYYILYVAIAVFGLGLLLFLYHRSKKLKSKQGTVAEPKVMIPVKKVAVKSFDVQLLGGFRIFDKQKEEITHKFSPKRKELLILLIFYTLKENGITSKKMGEILWPSFSPSSIKNNRSTQIKEIRKVFETYHMDISIVYEDKKWKIVFGGNITVDLERLNQYVSFLLRTRKSELSIEYLPEVINTVNSGSMLPNMEIEWLDDFKARYDNSILEVLTLYLEDDKSQVADDVLIDIANAILVIDPLHERAVKEKIELLIKQGKHMSAKKVAANFKKLYESFYKQEYASDLI